MLNLGDALAVRNEEKGGARLSAGGSRDAPFAGLRRQRHGALAGRAERALPLGERARGDSSSSRASARSIVEEQERPLRQWDYVHCPAGTRHIFVGAGEGPCAILMIGASPEESDLFYPVSEVAAKYGASAAKETPNPDEAYADWPGELRAGAPARGRSSSATPRRPRARRRRSPSRDGCRSRSSRRRPRVQADRGEGRRSARRDRPDRPSRAPRLRRAPRG